MAIAKSGWYEFAERKQFGSEFANLGFLPDRQDAHVSASALKAEMPSRSRPNERLSIQPLQEIRIWLLTSIKYVPQRFHYGSQPFSGGHVPSVLCVNFLNCLV